MRRHVVVVFTAAELFVVTRLSGTLAVAVRVGAVDAEVSTAHVRLGVLFSLCCGGLGRGHVRLLSLQCLSTGCSASAVAPRCVKAGGVRHPGDEFVELVAVCGDQRSDRVQFGGEAFAFRGL